MRRAGGRVAECWHFKAAIINERDRLIYRGFLPLVLRGGFCLIRSSDSPDAESREWVVMSVYL